MKIAFPTDDGATISRHFGRAPLFVVVTLGDDQVEESREQREKGYHAPGEPHSGPHPGMFEPLHDCRVLIAGGMGIPAYEKARAAGLEVIATREHSIDAALQAYRAGTLSHETVLVHAPHHH